MCISRFDTLAAMRRVFLFLLATGCYNTTGFLRDATTANSHQYRQDVGAIRYSRTVEAATSTGALLCAIPFGADPPYATAMRGLQENAKLKTNEVLENIREDHSITAFLVFWCVTTLTLSADVTEITAPGVPFPEDVKAKPEPKPEPKLEPKVEPKPALTVPDETSIPATSSTCELAFQTLFQTLQSLRRIYPNVAAAPVTKPNFLAVCAQQPKEVQWCIRAAYLRDNIDTCRVTFGDMAPAQRKRLFSTFSEGAD